MSEIKVEKVYVRQDLFGITTLVNALGMRLGAQEFLHLHGDSSGMKSATVKLSVDGKWSPEVAKEYIKSATDAAAVLSGRVTVTETGKAMEFELPEVSPEYVMFNGEKFVREHVSKLKGKLSVEVDTSAVDQAIKRIEDAREAFWKDQLAHGAVSIAGEVADLGPFPICPLESAISETIRHLREELQASGARSSDFPIGAYARLDAHLDELLRAQIDKVVK